MDKIYEFLKIIIIFVTIEQQDMYLGSNKIPQQKLALSKKTKKWREACVEAYIDLSTAGYSERGDWLKSLYDFYYGVIDDTVYRYVHKPLG